MNEYITRLIDLLAAQRDLYIQLTALSEQKREAVLSNSIDALDKVVKEEQHLLIRLQELERERKALLSSVAVVLSCPVDTLNVGVILEVCPPSQQGPLAQVRQELTAQLHAQANINEVNRKLLESRLEYLSFLTGAEGESNSYDPLGGDARKQEQNSRIIDMGV